MNTEGLSPSTSRVQLLVVLMIAVLTFWAATELTPTQARSANGYQVAYVTDLAPGVQYRRLVRSEGPVVAHVIRVQRGASMRQHAVLSNDRVDGPSPLLERTSEMCQRVNCIASVNGDFFQSNGEPVGGIAHGGRVLRSPVPGYDQLSVSAPGALTAGQLNWSGRLVSSGLGEVKLDGVNRQHTADGVILYTPDYGASTPASSSGARMILRVLEMPLNLGLGQSGLVEVVSFHEGGDQIPIPPQGAVLLGRGPGADALRALWERSKATLLGGRALLRLEMSPSMMESIGGDPILVREGRVSVPDPALNPDLIAKAHPRTIVGWNGSEIFLVAVDGRQPGYSVGLTLAEAADLLTGVGATDGINLDGGGSTTLAVRGKVVNRPSDRLVLRDGRQQIVTELRPGDTLIGHVERPVADAFAVVPTSAMSVLDELVETGLVTPPPGLRVPGPTEDPASRPKTLVNLRG